MLVSIIILATFILPVFLHRWVQKYGIFEVPDEVLYENILAVSSGRSYGIGQAEDLTKPTFCFKPQRIIYSSVEMQFLIYEMLLLIVRIGKHLNRLYIEIVKQDMFTE